MSSLDQQSLSDRLVAWVNSSGFDLGDERERLRYFEANAAALTVVQHLLPIVGAIAVLMAGERSAWAIFAVVMVPAIGIQLSRWYLHDQGVRIATQWLHMPRSRRYSLFACYDVFLAAMIIVGAIALDPLPLVILIGAQVFGLWIGEKDMLRRHDAEVAGTRHPVVVGRRRQLSRLYLVLFVINTAIVATLVPQFASEPFAVLLPAVVSVAMWALYRTQRRREVAQESEA